MLELLVAEALFCWCLPRKTEFSRKLVFAVILMLVTSFYLPYKNYTVDMTGPIRFLSILRYLALFFMSLGCIGGCFSCTLNEVLFYGIGAYAMQHFSFCVDRIVCLVLESMDIAVGTFQHSLIAFFSCLATYAPLYYIFIRYIHREKVKVTKDVVLPSMIVVLSTASINLYEYNSIPSKLCGCIICVLAMWILAGIFHNSQLEQELAAIHQMRSLKEEYYAISKENIETINLKCHDLKHQIGRIRSMSKESATDRYLEEVENNILIYDAVAQTGCLTLDIILTDKILYCEKNAIKLVYMADGEKLGFMEETDLYHLFGNALDNAIESVLKVQNSEERIISLVIRTVGNLLSIHLDNAFAGELKFEGGLQLTTKQDFQYHGYGLKSMRMTVEKYGGTMNVSAKHQLFCLNILIVPFTDCTRSLISSGRR